MLDLRFVTENIDFIQKKLQQRNSVLELSRLSELSEQRRQTIQQVERLKAQRNTVSSKIAVMKKNNQKADEVIAQMRQLGDEIKELDISLKKVEQEIASFMYVIPNIIDDSVPYGIDEKDNKEIRKVQSPRQFDFEPKPHWELGEKLGILNFEQAAKITGTRFTVYHDLGARLERAVINLMLDTHTQRGYKEVFPPFIVNRDSLIGTGQLPKFEEDVYALKGTDYFLIPTAEVPVTNLHRNEILAEEDLTISYCSYTACFRSEAGSAGRDTRGLIRQHQFNKVELVKFALPENSFQELEALTNDAEHILQLLELPYRVVVLCSADVGFSSAKTYDIEVFMPSYNRYVEISSCSNFTDFQARRANIRYKDNFGKNKLVHTLNGSGLAVGRTVAAIMENYQNLDGTITIPKALIKYMHTDIIK